MVVEHSDSFGRYVASNMIGEARGKDRRAYSQGKNLIVLYSVAFYKDSYSIPHASSLQVSRV